MNLAEEANKSPSRQSVFAYKNQWSEVTPPYMPWGHSPNSPAAPLVTFNAQNPQMSTPTPHTFGNSLNNPKSSFGKKLLMHYKRKADLDLNPPSKQHITEEKMAAHMSRLHISSETHTEPFGFNAVEIEDFNDREKRLYLCEEMRKLQTESILPSSLLGRLERPCMAVMLWQPPAAKMPELIGCASTSSGALRSDAPSLNNRQFLEEDENENNSSTTDLNNMDMDS